MPNGNDESPRIDRKSDKPVIAVESMAQAEFYDSFIDHFKAQEFNYRNNYIKSLLNKYILNGSKVLDIGCGIGITSDHLEKNKGCEVWAFDLSKECIKLASERNPKVKFQAKDILNANLPNDFFSFIVMADSIEHIKLNRHRTLFEKLKNCSKDGAVLIMNWGNPLFNDKIKQLTPQPVEEMVWPHKLLKDLYDFNFKLLVEFKIHFKGFYYSLVVQKV